jgi:hypothetical protein
MWFQPSAQKEYAFSIQIPASVPVPLQMSLSSIFVTPVKVFFLRPGYPSPGSIAVLKMEGHLVIMKLLLLVSFTVGWLMLWTLTL